MGNKFIRTDLQETGTGQTSRKKIQTFQKVNYMK